MPVLFKIRSLIAKEKYKFLVTYSPHPEQTGLYAPNMSAWYLKMPKYSRWCKPLTSKLTLLLFIGLSPPSESYKNVTLDSESLKESKKIAIEISELIPLSIFRGGNRRWQISTNLLI